MTGGDWTGEDRRAHKTQQPGLSTLEKSVIYLAQGAILIGVGWVIATVIDVKQSIVRIETRYEASVIDRARVDNELISIRTRLQISDTAVQTHSFKLEDHERRLKGLELVRERLK